MTLARRLAPLAAVLLAAACGGGPSGAPALSDDALSQRVADYYEKSVSTPGVSFKVAKYEDTGVPGWRRGTLVGTLGQQSQTVPFYVSADGHYLFRSDMIDLTVDPLKQIMSKIALDDQPERGPRDAKVTIVEYSDFQCPFCSRVYATLENEVLKGYGDKVRFVFKNFPLKTIHPWAEDAALASECAFQQGNDQFWTMYNGLFSKQGEINKENLKDKASEFGKAGGLDVARLQECLAGKQSQEAVDADVKEATALGVSSTPTFFVNGRKLSGALSPADFKQAIDRELAAKG
jgi:protein-disulfide isomerase